jgi:hypothetical protein
MELKMKDDNFEKAMADFLAKGGVIQQAAYRESGRVEGAPYTSPWGAKKAGRPPAADIDPTIEVEDEE